MLFPIRLTDSGWPPGVRRVMRRFMWLDPRLVLDPGLDAASYSLAMAAFEVGSTRRITGAGRHAAADALLDRLDLSDAVIVDMGASDGITSVELVERLGRFREYVITDLCLVVDVARTGPRMVFRDAAGRVVVVAGPHFVAWPASSALVRLLYRPIMARTERSGQDGAADLQVPLLNPATRRLLERDPRVQVRAHDIFTAWPGPRPDLVKVANVLRRLYFSVERIRAALAVILFTLPEGGHLLLIDNPRVTPPVPVRGCLYRRTGDRFEVVGRTGQPTEAHDLVLQVRARHLTSPDR